MTAATIFKVSPTVKALMKKKLAQLNKAGGLVKFFYSNGVPTTDTDIAEQDGDLCWDGESNDIYVATNVVTTPGEATTTWTNTTWGE